ncbi:MAG: ATP-binding protein [Phycisphaerales bacterium]|nr:ATP-binding protein [Phycisphaerales bacterium]
MLCLRVIEGPDAGRQLPLPPGEPQLLGRSSEALPLTDRAVSRRHAELTPDGGRWYLRDLDSTSGTSLNGALVTTRQSLSPGDEIRLGQTRLMLDHDETLRAGPDSSTQVADHTHFSPVSAEDAPAVLEALLPALAAAIDGDDSPVLSSALPEEIAEALQQLASTRTGLQRRAHLAAMGEGVATVSHAIKNILQGLQGGAGALSLALEREDLSMALKAWPIVSRNLDRVSDLALNMLAYSRPRPVQRRLQSIEAIVSEVMLLLEEPFASHRAKLTNAGEGDLPPVPVDAAALHQALLNLVLNALQSIEARRGQVEISVGLEPSHAWVAVDDNGPGVPEDQQASIMEPFASTRGQRGTGLGLAVTRRIARQHGGDLTVGRSPLGGARFLLTLSLDLPGQDADETDMPEGGPLSTDERFAGGS